jgi:hypothetical protein
VLPLVAALCDWNADTVLLETWRSCSGSSRRARLVDARGVDGNGHPPRLDVEVEHGDAALGLLLGIAFVVLGLVLRQLDPDLWRGLGLFWKSSELPARHDCCTAHVNSYTGWTHFHV